MEKSTRYLDRYKDIIKDLAVKFNLPEEEIVEMIDHFFQTLKKYITDIRMPTIKISKWGTFKPLIGEINWGIGKSLYHMNLEQGDREKMFGKIRIIQRIKERLLQEKKGIETWKRWSKMKPEELEAESKDW